MGPEPSGPTRIGIFGGTFDPIHIGHLSVAQDLVRTLELDTLFFVPAARPPHKPVGAAASGEQRIEMLGSALSDVRGALDDVHSVVDDPRTGADYARSVVDDAHFVVDDREFHREGPSYSLDTVREYREEHPGAELFFVIGVDQLAELDTWHEPELLARTAHLVVVARNGEDPGRVNPGVDVTYTVVPVARVDVSSTEIRNRRARSASIEDQVPGPVARIIEREKLYLEAPSG